MKVGIEDATAVISYRCSGITACHNLLALEHAGLGRGRLYAGGWTECGAEPRRLTELGRQPTCDACSSRFHDLHPEA